MKPTLVNLWLNELDDAALNELADRLAPRLTTRMAATQPSTSRWLNSKAPAEYLGISLNVLHKHTAERTIPFEQAGPGCKCRFHSDELDARGRDAAKNASKPPCPHSQSPRKLPDYQGFS